MAFKEISIDEIPAHDTSKQGSYPRCRPTLDLIDFMRSDAQACELDTTGYANASKARYPVLQYIRRNGLNCTALVRNNRLFAVKTSAVKKEEN